jgi:hypothetical protein
MNCKGMEPIERADGTILTLLKSGRQTRLYEVTRENSPLVKYEVCVIDRINHEVDEDETRTFLTLASAEKYFLLVDNDF